MKARFLLAAAAFACAVFTAEAFDSFKDAFQAARTARNEKKADEALKILEEAKSLAKNPWQKYQVLDFSVEIYMWNKKDMDTAISKLDEIINNEESKADWKANALTKKANFLKWNGKKDQSEDLYKKALALDIAGGTKQNVMNSYADLLRINKKFDEALKLYEDSVALEKGAPHFVNSAKLGIATVKADQKDYDKALELYNELLKTPDLNFWVAEPARRYIVEKVYFPQNKYAEAAEYLNKLEADQEVPENQKKWIPEFRIRINLAQGGALIRENKLDEAAEKLNAIDDSKITSTGMKNWVASTKAYLENSRGNALKKEKKFEEAIEAYKKVLDVKNVSDYSKYDAYMNIFSVLTHNLKKPDEAKEYLDKAIALPKLNLNHQLRNQHALASYYLAKGNVDDAVAALEKAVAIEGKVDPSQKAYAYTRLAEIYFYRKKDLAKADEYVKKSMAVPDAKWGFSKGLADRIQKALEKQNQ